MGRMSQSVRRIFGRCSSAGWLCELLQCKFLFSRSFLSFFVSLMENGNQKPFEKMIIMKYDCVGIGVVKMTVGVRRRTHEKVQYCITALEI